MPAMDKQVKASVERFGFAGSGERAKDGRVACKEREWLGEVIAEPSRMSLTQWSFSTSGSVDARSQTARQIAT